MNKLQKMAGAAAVCLMMTAWTAGTVFAFPETDSIELINDLTTDPEWNAGSGSGAADQEGTGGPGVANQEGTGGPGVGSGTGTVADSSGTGNLYAYGYGTFDNDLYQKCQTIKSKETANSMMSTITVPVWRLKGQNKVPGTATITVNSGIASTVSQIFQEIYDGPQQFPISDAGGFAWRGESAKSEHNWGTALDLNSNSNYCVYANGTVVGDHWTPGEDPYSFSADSDVVKAFKKHGFAWGGDWPWDNRDYMHFSYFGT